MTRDEQQRVAAIARLAALLDADDPRIVVEAALLILESAGYTKKERVR